MILGPGLFSNAPCLCCRNTTHTADVPGVEFDRPESVQPCRRTVDGSYRVSACQTPLKHINDPPSNAPSSENTVRIGAKLDASVAEMTSGLIFLKQADGVQECVCVCVCVCVHARACVFKSNVIQQFAHGRSLVLDNSCTFSRIIHPAASNFSCLL